jgi:flagellar protein FlaG
MSSINASSAQAPLYQNIADRTEKPAVADIKPASQANVAVDKAASQPISAAEIQQAIDVVNQAVAIEQRSLSFSIDDASGRSVIKVIDYETDELIKQIPTEELLKVAQDIKRLQEEMGQSIGLLVDNKV